MVGARRLAPAVAWSYGGAGVQGCLILSQVGLLFPVNHAFRLRSEATADRPAFAQKLRRTGPPSLRRCEKIKIRENSHLEVVDHHARHFAFFGLLPIFSQLLRSYGGQARLRSEATADRPAPSH